MNHFNKKYPKTAKAIRYIGNTAQIAHQAYNMARVVASIVNSEKKYHDVSGTITPDSASASVNCLTNMAQGDTNILRNGNTIAVKSLQLQMLYNHDLTAAADFETVKCALVRSFDNLDGTAPTWTDVYESLSVLSWREKDKPQRFKVLKEFMLMPNRDKGVYNREFYHKFLMKKDHKGNPTVSDKITFDGPTANDFCRGHIWLLVYGNVAGASTLSSINWNSRLRYYDN